MRPFVDRLHRMCAYEWDRTDDDGRRQMIADMAEELAHLVVGLADGDRAVVGASVAALMLHIGSVAHEQCDIADMMDADVMGRH